MKAYLAGAFVDGVPAPGPRDIETMDAARVAVTLTAEGKKEK
jgi:hypothetical protein